MKIKINKIRIDGGTQPRENINEEIVYEYATAMMEGESFPDVVVFNDGANYWLADGFHRYHASKKLGYLELNAEVKSGTKRDAVLYSVSANSKHGLRRTNADKRKAVLTLLNDEEWSQWSDREIGRQCSVSDRMVNKYRSTAKYSQIESERKVKRGGQEYTVDTTNIGKSEKPLLDNQIDFEPKEDGGYDIECQKAHVSYNSGNNEWYTPLEYVNSARFVMGCIDLDPATTEEINEKIKAEFYYTKTTDGLSQKWHGNIWMNPPYENGLISEFIDKLNYETFLSAIVLVNNATETKWGNTLINMSDVVCFIKGRIRFISIDGEEKNSPLQGQMICYIGSNPEKFINEFKKYGVCLIAER